MRNWRIMIDRECHAFLEELNLQQVPVLKSNELLLRTCYSVVSSGTELSIYRGTESWAPLPYNPGYGAIGQVMETGHGVERIKEGDYVFAYSPHQLYSVVETEQPGARPVVKIDKDDCFRDYVVCRIAAVSITALRVSPPELGDWVVVVGQGLVGNLAAQIFGLAGGRVIAVDVSETRLEKSRHVGVEYTVNAEKEDVKARIMEITGGMGTRIGVEATGVPAMVKAMSDYSAKDGEVVLLGSPRGKTIDDVTELLNRVHLWSHGCVTLKGAHEWRYPLVEGEGYRHSIERNCRILLELIRKGKLKVAPLISHCVSPQRAQEMYQGLLNNREKYLGVVFDWSAIQ